MNRPNSTFPSSGSQSARPTAAVIGDGGAAGSPGSGSATTVTYRAEFEFKGVAKLVAPLFAPAFKKLGDEAERGLRRALGQLA